jgi:hypothetical protein
VEAEGPNELEISEVLDTNTMSTIAHKFVVGLGYLEQGALA